MKKILASVAATAVLAGGGLAVAALDPLAGAGASTSPTTAATAPTRSSATSSATSAVRHPRLRALAKHALAVSADTIGVDTTTLVGEIRDGKTIAQVAQEHGVQPQTVIDALVRAADQRIDQAVADHHLTAEQATKLKARVPTAAERLVDHTRLAARLPRLRALATRALAVSADTIGVDTKTLVGEIRDGKTVAQVAQEHGVQPQTVIDALVRAADQRIDQAVADHHLTAEQATKLKARVPTAAERFVDHTPHPRAAPAPTTGV